MAESYIPAEAYVICSNMTCGVPRKLLPSRGAKTVAHSNGSKILLTVEDRKIDKSFECVEKCLDWGGFEALAAGICIGALVVATVATGGLALAATGVMYAAAGATVISGVGGIISIANACDCTLESTWSAESSSVSFNKNAALLNRSFMKCKNKGVINIILDKQIAMDAAKAISDSNMNAFYWKMGSQFVMGAITAITAASSGVSLVGAAVLAVPSYFSWGLKLSPTAKNTVSGIITYGAGLGSGAGAAGVGVGIMVGSNVAGSVPKTIVGAVINKIGVNEQKATIETLKNPGPAIRNTPAMITTGTKTAFGYIQYGWGVLTKNMDTQLKGAIRTAVHSKHFKAIEGKGFVAGIVGAAVNVGIGIVADNNIDDYQKEASRKNDFADIDDKSNSINVVSIRG
ncbi:type IV secretion protein Rhs [Prevotella histicola]|mgnify:CR=1 FL=1|uniref:type IV secretion protein Rhs n=1 Tax=Prevotella histicola TaxID=470565 RepID=UPI0028E25208|nr:type IV secretion protein Rhs [Prevotella histicola]